MLIFFSDLLWSARLAQAMKTLLTLSKFSTTAATRRGRYYGPTSTSSRKALDRTLSISSYRAWNHCACRLRRWICVLGQYKEHVAWRNAFSVLSFGAVSVTMSARFARKGAFNCRTFHGNPIALWSYLIMTVLQVFITYCPGLNTTIFSMEAMDGWSWGIVVLFMFCVLVVMETEKAARNYLTKIKYTCTIRMIRKIGFSILLQKEMILLSHPKWTASERTRLLDNFINLAFRVLSLVDSSLSCHAIRER